MLKDYYIFCWKQKCFSAPEQQNDSNPRFFVTLGWAAEILHITLKSYKAITHFSSLTRDISDLNWMFFVCKCSVHKVLAQCYCTTRAYILWGAIKMMAHTASCKNRAIIQLFASSAAAAAYCCCVVMVHQLMLDLQKQATNTFFSREWQHFKRLLFCAKKTSLIGVR